VKLLGDQPDGERSLLAIYIPGNCFCESPVIAGRPHHHTHTAAGETRIGILRKTDFDELCKLHPAISEALCRKLAATLSSLISYRETQNQTTVGQRVALILHNLAEVSQTPRHGDYKEIDVPITISEMSTFLGLTRQTIQKEISQLKKRNLIEKLPGNWAVREMKTLADLSQASERQLAYSE
jgi:CRP-like cAMP-binding protein